MPANDEIEQANEPEEEKEEEKVPEHDNEQVDEEFPIINEASDREDESDGEIYDVSVEEVPFVRLRPHLRAIITNNVISPTIFRAVNDPTQSKQPHTSKDLFLMAKVTGQRINFKN